MRSSSAGSGAAPRSGTVDGDAVAAEEVDRLCVSARIGDEDVDLVELREAEHLDVAELGLIDQSHQAVRALDHRALERVFFSVRSGQAVLEREPVAADE